MHKWLPDAKTLRKAAFFAGGAGMAVSTAKAIGDRISSQKGVLKELVAEKQKIDSGLAKAKKQATVAGEISVMYVGAAVPAGAAAEEKAGASESKPGAEPRLLSLLESTEPSHAGTTGPLVMV